MSNLFGGIAFLPVGICLFVMGIKKNLKGAQDQLGFNGGVLIAGITILILSILVIIDAL